jgi:hypothetical protein
MMWHGKLLNVIGKRWRLASEFPAKPELAVPNVGVRLHIETDMERKA